MVYLIVGVDRRTLEAWHRNVAARDIGAARRTARRRARAVGVDLVGLTVIGPYSSVLDADPAQVGAEAA